MATPAPAPLATPTPILVVVVPVSTPIPVTMVTDAPPAGLPTPQEDGVIAVLNGSSRGTGSIQSTPAAWNGAGVEVRVDNDGKDAVVDFQPMAAPPAGVPVPDRTRVSRTFSLEIYNYDPITRTASHRSDE